LVINTHMLPLLMLKNNKNKNMKKLLAIIAVGAIVTACNSETDTTVEDESIRIADSTRMADSLANSMMMDTTHMDSTNMMMDSTMH
jgi:hypothetical protein